MESYKFTNLVNINKILQTVIVNGKKKTPQTEKLINFSFSDF